MKDISVLTENKDSPAVEDDIAMVLDDRADQVDARKRSKTTHH